MKLYTKRGDKGYTSLLGKDRVKKDNIRVMAYGSVDELGAHVGYLRDQDVNRTRQAFLLDIQRALFVIGAQLACTVHPLPSAIPRLSSASVGELEREIDRMQSILPPMRYFILNGGHKSVSIGHIARCVCRRAERHIVGLSAEQEVGDGILVYMNRLSDYLFALCRIMGQDLGVEEVPWKGAEKEG